MNQHEFDTKLKSLFTRVKREEPGGHVLARVISGTVKRPVSQIISTPVVGLSFAFLILLVVFNIAVLISATQSRSTGDEHYYELKLLDGTRY